MIDRGWEGTTRLQLNGYNDGRLKRARVDGWFGEWRAKSRPQDTNHGEPLTPMRSLSHYDNVIIVCPDHGGHEQYLNLALLRAVDSEIVAMSREAVTFTPLD
jgi:hypothetical protein